MRLPTLVFAALLLIGNSLGASAQPTNEDIYSTLAASCVDAAVDTLNSLSINSPEAMPFVAQRLITQWRAAGKTIFLGSSDGATRLSLLDLAFENASITYKRRSRRSVTRSVRVTTRFMLTSHTGLVLATGSCTDTAEDEVDTKDLDRLENSTYPVTQGARPRSRWIARYAEPAIAGAAVIVTTVLLFTLRSDSGSE